MPDGLPMFMIKMTVHIAFKHAFMSTFHYCCRHLAHLRARTYCPFVKRTFHIPQVRSCDIGETATSQRSQLVAGLADPLAGLLFYQHACQWQGKAAMLLCLPELYFPGLSIAGGSNPDPSH